MNCKCYLKEESLFNRKRWESIQNGELHFLGDASSAHVMIEENTT